MTRDNITRRQVLSSVSGAGAAGLAGCGSFFQSGSPYACTDIDDESIETYDEPDNPIPYTFEFPEVMSVDNVNRAQNAGRVAFEYNWKDRRGLDTYRHELALEVSYGTSQRAVKQMTVSGDEPPPDTVYTKRDANGYGVGLYGEADDLGATFRMWIPSMDDGSRVFYLITVEVSAILQGRREIEEDARRDDTDQTCREAMRVTAIDVIDSIPVVSPAAEETTLSITPSSATVRRGESVDLTVEASGVEWVDLLVGGDEAFDYSTSLAVGDDTTTLRVAPPTDGSTQGSIAVAEGGRLRADVYDELVPGEYSVVIRAPGTDGLVTASTSLTVEPAG